MKVSETPCGRQFGESIKFDTYENDEDKFAVAKREESGDSAAAAKSTLESLTDQFNDPAAAVLPFAKLTDPKITNLALTLTNNEDVSLCTALSAKTTGDRGGTTNKTTTADANLVLLASCTVAVISDVEFAEVRLEVQEIIPKGNELASQCTPHKVVNSGAT